MHWLGRASTAENTAIISLKTGKTDVRTGTVSEVLHIRGIFRTQSNI